MVHCDQALRVACLLVHKAATRTLDLDLLADREQGQVLRDVTLVVCLQREQPN